jgi:hypothetical protein
VVPAARQEFGRQTGRERHVSFAALALELLASALVELFPDLASTWLLVLWLRLISPQLLLRMNGLELKLNAPLVLGWGPESSSRPRLRVKRMQGHPGVWEMSWAPDGRATFEYGDEIHQGQAHIVRRRVGTHSIFRRP